MFSCSCTITARLFTMLAGLCQEQWRMLLSGAGGQLVSITVIQLHSKRFIDFYVTVFFSLFVVRMFRLSASTDIWRQRLILVSGRSLTKTKWLRFGSSKKWWSSCRKGSSDRHGLMNFLILVKWESARTLTIKHIRCFVPVLCLSPERAFNLCS